MSSSDEVVMQEKDDATPVTWGDYQHLRQHLTGAIDKSSKDLLADFTTEFDGLNTQLTANDTKVTAMQTQMIDLQASVATLQASIENLSTTVDQRFQQLPQFEDDFDDGGVAGDIPNPQAQGRGRGNHANHPGRGRGWVPLHRAQRIPLHAPDDGLGPMALRT